jgi:transcription antitermination factor NusA-like protein
VMQLLKTPICTFDAKTSVLCTKCETKLRLGQLTHADVDGAIKIAKLTKDSQEVNNFTMIGASKVDDDFILTLRSSDINILRTNASLFRRFEDEFQSKVWFVEGQATDRRFIENLMFPAKVLAVHITWLPDGSKSTNVKVSAQNKLEVRSKIERIKRIAREIRNIELVVEFEGIN